MTLLNDAVRMALKKSVLCWLATVDADGCPNVSPKEIFCSYGSETLLIANIASPGSARNVTANAAVCVSFVDPFVQKGFKIKGRAQLVDNTEACFAKLASPLELLAGPRFPFASTFVIQVIAIEPILAPGYVFYPDTSESTQIEAAMKAYGVCPGPP